MKRFILFFTIVLTLVLLIPLIKGDKGNPLRYQSEKDTSVGGPFESTNSNSRFALTEAIVENNSFSFSEEEARFGAPDIVRYNGKYFSIFTPGVSFISVPFYLVGMYFSVPQLITYFSTLVLALANVGLIFKLARKVGGGFYASLIAGLCFLFATNALPYAFTITQHHATIFFILLALINVLEKRTIKTNVLFGFYYIAALLMDIPNAFLMLPLLLVVITDNFEFRSENQKMTFKIKSSLIFLVIGMLPLLAVFGWYNWSLTGSYIKLGQIIGRSNYPAPETIQYISPSAKIEETSIVTWKKPLETPFDTRLQLNGLYILLFSNERSWWMYSPVIFFGVIGMGLLYQTKKNTRVILLSVSIIAINIVLYSMFADPWGGWSFGPRYLLPSASLLSIFIAYFLTLYRKSILLQLLFFLVLLYSIYINVLGAATTNSIAPKVEAEQLLVPIPYTYQYNTDFLLKNQSSSLVYNLYLRNILSARDFVIILVAITSLAFIALIVINGLASEPKKI